MSATTCSTHPATAAEYRYDGCELVLCDECIKVGHRLFFCRYCGERAPYSFQKALAYPFRGLGGYVFWGIFAVLSPVPFVGRLAALGIPLYAMFVSTHLIGLLPRRHERDLEPIYCH